MANDRTSEYNEIFGYEVYKPPPEQNLPIIADLNCYGEIVTLIDPNADVIQDPTVQRIFKSLDGERTVKIEDLPPDVRYEGWNKKAQYDKQVIEKSAGSKVNLQPQLPTVNQNLLKANENHQHYQQEGLRQAQLKAASTQMSEKEFAKSLQETRIALEKEIHKQLVEQLTLRAQKHSVTPDQQALIEKLYLDLRLINPELALGTLKAYAISSGVVANNSASGNAASRYGGINSRQAQPNKVPANMPREPSNLVHNQGSIVNDTNNQFMQQRPEKPPK